MFYTKATIGGTTITTEITDENVFTRCAECGDEIPVDIEEVIIGGGDLCGTNVYCDACTKRRLAQQH